MIYGSKQVKICPLTARPRGNLSQPEEMATKKITGKRRQTVYALYILRGRSVDPLRRRDLNGQCT
jgi:hypothetical protein